MSKKETSTKAFKAAKAEGKAEIATAQAIAYADTVIDQLEALNVQRAQWEATDYKKANEGLYALLSQCYAVFEQKFLYAELVQKKELRSTLVQRLQAAGIHVVKTSHTLTMLVRYVFQSDRNRAHGYATVLVSAIEHGKNSTELVAWIIEQGGVEQIKLKKREIKPERVALIQQLKAAQSRVEDEIKQATHVPMAKIDVHGLTGDYAILLAKPNVKGGADIVGTLSNVSDALYAALLKQMSMQLLKNDEEFALLDKETVNLLGAPAQEKQAEAIAA